jgi:hypothetical protein
MFCLGPDLMLDSKKIFAGSSVVDPHCLRAQVG